MSILKICLNCKKEFQAERNARQYCGKECKGLSRRCSICGVKHDTMRPTGLEAWYKHPKNGKTICNKCYNKIPRKGKCVECGKTESTRWSSNEKGTICHNCEMVLYRVKIKLKVFTHYCKGKPICCIDDCNIDDIDMLALDHINDDGWNHRKEIGGKSGFLIYDWAMKNNYPEIFRVMCWNHNIKKQMMKLKLRNAKVHNL